MAPPPTEELIKGFGIGFNLLTTTVDFNNYSWNSSSGTLTLDAYKTYIFIQTLTGDYTNYVRVDVRTNYYSNGTFSVPANCYGAVMNTSSNDFNNIALCYTLEDDFVSNVMSAMDRNGSSGSYYKSCSFFLQKDKISPESFPLLFNE